MRIGYYIMHFPYKSRLNDRTHFKQYKYGGAEIVAYQLVVNMAQRNHEINVFTTSVDSKNHIEKYKNIKIYRYGKNFKVGHSIISFGMFQKPIKYQVDIIHVHSSVAIAGIAAMRYAKRKNTPLVLTHHGDVQESYGGVLRRVGVFFCNKYLINKVLSHADVIISPSEYYIDESRFLGKYRDKIVVIPNGINIEDFDVPYSKEECREKLGLSINKNIILFVGNLIPYKGPDVLVKAMSRVVKEVPDVELVFVGSGKMREELKKLSKKLQIEKNVKFTGFVKESLKSLYYKAADVFCLPSTLNTEVFPIVLLEASASGLPMVVSDLDTFKCIIEEGYNGLFTKRRDENNLADAIIYLLENEDMREKMGKNGREKVEDYSWERIAEETEKVYKDVLNIY